MALKKLVAAILPVLALVAGCKDTPSPTSPSATPEKESGSVELAGTWSGDVSFVNGWEASGEMVLTQQAPGHYEGMYELEIHDEETTSEETGRLRFVERSVNRWDGHVIDDGSESDGEPDFEARISSAMPFAKAALYGTFDSEAGRGVFLLFK
jgi:hypothetical protein